MTTNLMIKRYPKARIGQIPRKLELEIDDFISVYPKSKLPNMINSVDEKSVPLDLECEVSGAPTAKHIRMVTLKIESRGKAKFESMPLDIYTEI